MPNMPGDANAISVLCAGAMGETVRELGAVFARNTGIVICAQYTRSGLVRDRVCDGEIVDVVISTQTAIDDLARGQFAVAGSAAAIARSGIGVAVRAGQSRPDIGSIETFKRALLAARSIAYADPATGSPSGHYLVGLFDRLGMSADLKPKTRLVGASGGHAVVVCDFVANGEAEIGLQQISEIVPVAGVDLVGPLPPEIQHMTVFSGAVASKAPKPDLARRFVRFISSDAARPVIRDNGMEPG